MREDILSSVTSHEGRIVSGEETSEKDPVRELEEAKVKSSFGTSQTYTILYHLIISAISDHL